MHDHVKTFTIVVFLLACSTSPLLSQPPENRIARQGNPLGFISVPLQNNFDFNIPSNCGFRWTLNIMPIVPVQLGKKVNLINRVVLPVISQVNIYGSTGQTGLGDLLLNTFLSPAKGRMIWGIGPSFYFPTGFPQELSAKKWAAGPGGIAAIQAGKFMVATMVFHLWSFTGDENRPDFSYSYLQPLMTYGISHGWGLGLTTEIGLEWKRNITNGSVILTAQKTSRIGRQLINFVVGPKIYYGNFNAPEFGFRATVNLLFP